jgi:hypothetical protein
MRASTTVQIAASSIVLLAFLGACGAKEQLEESKVQQVKLQVRKFAAELYPEWAMKSVNAECPASIVDLATNVGLKAGDADDAWGTQLKMLCGKTLPPQLKHGIGVVSAGPDKQFDTADDVRSW